MTTTAVPTAADLQHGRSQAEGELAQARRDHAIAAYEFAADRDSPKKRDAVLAAKQRMDLLEAEIQGLGAAGDEAARREAEASRQSDLANRTALLKSADKAIDAVAVTLAEAAPLAAKLGELRRKAMDQLDSALGAVHGATLGVTSFSDSNPFNQSAIDTVMHGLLQSTGVVRFEVFRMSESSTDYYLQIAKQEAEGLKQHVDAMRNRVRAHLAD